MDNNQEYDQKAIDIVREIIKKEAETTANAEKQKQIETEYSLLKEEAEKQRAEIENRNKKLAIDYEDLRDAQISVKSIIEKTSNPNVTIETLKALAEDHESSNINNFFKNISEEELEAINKCDTAAKMTRRIEKLMNKKEEVEKKVEIPEPVKVESKPTQPETNFYDENGFTSKSQRNEFYQNLWNKSKW